VAEPAHDGNDTRLGRLRTYLGTAPGVGKTYAMLNHGWRRSEGGERVVVGWIERHGRAETQAQLRNLEVVPRRSVDYRGSRFDELDVAAIMARQPDVVLIDELAHTHVDGTRKRWEDAAELLAAGLSVMTTVNVANLVSARDYAARVTGVGTVESVPDEFVRSGEVVLIDPPPEALRRRIAAGNVYTADTVGGVLASYFRMSNLAALGELARAWMAGSLGEVGPAVLGREGVGPLARRPTVLAGVSGSEWSGYVIHSAIVRAQEDDADLLVVHVNVADGLGRRGANALDRYRDMAIDAGGHYVEVDGTNVADSLAAVARERHATRIVVARHRSRLNELVRGSVASRMRRLVRGTPVDEVHRQR
jgi:two-component system sensor histidine kinase KdpD